MHEFSTSMLYFLETVIHFGDWSLLLPLSPALKLTHWLQSVSKSYGWWMFTAGVWRGVEIVWPVIALGAGDLHLECRHQTVWPPALMGSDHQRLNKTFLNGHQQSQYPAENLMRLKPAAFRWTCFQQNSSARANVCLSFAMSSGWQLNNRTESFLFSL